MRSALLVSMMFVLTAVLLSGCTQSATVLTSDDDGSTVKLTVGETLDVELPGNPTTGFEWTEDDPLPTVLESLSSEYAQDDADSEMVGVGGTYTFHYEVAEEGEGVLALTEARQGNPPEVGSTWSVTIMAEAAD